MLHRSGEFLSTSACFLLVPADLVWAAYLTPSSACLQEMDRAFGGDGTSVPSADTMQEAATCLYFPADLRESSTQYKFLIDLPGVPKSDIKVCIISTLSAQYCSAWFLVYILIVASFVLRWCPLWLTALLVTALCGVHQGHLLSLAYRVTCNLVPLSSGFGSTIVRSTCALH